MISTTNTITTPDTKLPEVMNQVSKIKNLPPRNFVFSRKEVGKCEIGKDYFPDDQLVQGNFTLADNLGYSIPYRTAWFHRKRMWQFHLARTWMMIQRNFIPFNITNFPSDNINIPRSNGDISIGKINIENYSAGTIRTSQRHNEGDTKDCYIPVIFESNGETYNKQVTLTKLIQVNPSMSSLKITIPPIQETCEQEDMESEYREDIYYYFRGLQNDWIDLIVTPVFERISADTGIPIEVEG